MLKWLKAYVSNFVILGGEAIALAAVKSRFEAVVEHSRDAILLIDPEGTVLEWNRGATLLYGFSREEVVGKPYRLTPNERRGELSYLIRKVQKGEEVDGFETERLNKSGARVHVSLTLSPLLDDGGKLITILSIARDISERERLRLEMERAEKLAGIGRLAAGIAHQLNTPLGSILLSAQLVEEGLPGGGQRENLRKIVRQTEHCKRVIEELLNFSRVQEDRKEVVSVYEILKKVQSLWEKELVDARIDFHLNCGSRNDVIYGNANQLEQVFFNLVLNAKDAMPAGGGLHVTTDKRDGKWLHVVVSDTGCGVKPEERSKIFEPFYTSKPVGRGTGLGLAVAEHIVRGHGGEIHMESEVGRGTAFIVRLPILPLEREMRWRE